uniref:Uncharacterized protein n=1 Tax=Globodera pallida TaxID=36090 RepID=A0A183BHH3_GLOPA
MGKPSSSNSVIRTIFNLVAEKIVHKCANVESAREADETMFEADSETGEDVAGGESGDTSPVIRLGNGGGGWEPFRTELGEWARLISCRSWWGYSEKTAATNGGSSCCSAL